ncbi:epimerase family protein SDR39U1 [Orussus abietinus]|uniref:epimerase family protein SDR39U1 n=1 Tax=Orussus abietinus TaxID=222816 RepID=UPI0006253022|nr:epimerase family protein SDR39U1 [Orussus abietinus]XP_012286100.1 epimerase family protein SDR39U1 [Orussus abietinus]
MALRRVVVGGGTGFIGSSLVRALRSAGARVLIVCREPEQENEISWEDVKRSGLPADISGVINVAGQNVLDPLKRWSPKFKEEVWDSRVQTTKILASAIVKTNAEVFTTISGVAYYKPSDKIYTENTKCEKYDFLSELCHEWEAAAKLPINCNIRQVVIRSGVVLGRTGGMIKQIFYPFYLGMGGPIGSGEQYMPWIHINDLCNLFIHVLIRSNVSGVLNGVAPQIITNEQFTKAFAAALHRPALIPVPIPILSLIFHPERAKIMTEGQKVVPKRVLETGFQYEYSTIVSACKKFNKLFYIDELM